MAKVRSQQNSLYGTPNGLQSNLLAPLVTTRSPTVLDVGYQYGQLWVNKDTGQGYILVKVSSGQASWELLGNSPTADVQQLQGNTGGPINPVGGIINVIGSGNVSVAGAGNTLTITDTTQQFDFSSTGTTTDATPQVVIYSFDVGATAGCLAIEATFVAYCAALTTGATFKVNACIYTDGTTTTEISNENWGGAVLVDNNVFTVGKDNVQVRASANDVIFSVTGLLATTIDWLVYGTYRKVT